MREKTCGIYSITNTVNGKRIIGRSKDIRHRWWFHKWQLNTNRHENPHLQYAWNKYGKDNFKFEVIFLCPEENLDNEEIRLIKECKTTDSNLGYNLASGGKTPKLSEETKRKISKSNTGKKRSEVSRQRIREGKLGSANGMFGIHRCGKDSHMFGKSHSEETKQKIGLSAIGNRGFAGHKHSEERKKKMSDITRAYWAKKKQLTLQEELKQIE